jgi:anti-sigma B factor antagonist
MTAGKQGQSSGVRWEVDTQHGLITVRLFGELDLASSTAVQTVLDEAVADSPLTVVDLGGLDFMDSTGLRLLASAQKTAEQSGARFLLGRPSPAVLRVLTVSGLVEHFDYVEGTPPV